MNALYEGIIKYHERTKHYPYRYARSSGTLDWDSEPNPFRIYGGAPLISLPFLGEDPDITFTAMFDRKGIASRPFSLRNVACFLELSMGLSAWKSYGENSWALRINPSSGNLHPVEAYLVIPPLSGDSFSGGVFHYTPLRHALETRASFDAEFWSRIGKLFPGDGFFAGLSCIHWREAWKYGERAFRYSHLDMGHAIAAMSFSAALLGWKITYLNALSDRDVETIFGFKRTQWHKFEEEEPGPLLFVHRADGKPAPRGLPEEAVQSFVSLSYRGEPNLLSPRHEDWSAIDEVSSLTVKPAAPEETYHFGDHPYFLPGALSIKAADVIRNRRSALAYDAKTSLPRERFFEILDKTVPRSCCTPFDGEFGETSVHLLLFVHRITGLKPGLYFLIREKKDLEKIREKCRPGLLWEKVPETPATLPLYLLERGSFRTGAAAASCDQDIASDGAFAAAMIARFKETVEHRPERYRYIHWEAGIIGQVLYLGAEAQGMRGTGMGCFFDNSVHALLGYSDSAYQDIYHFAVGKPIEDSRLATFPPYHHLKKQ
jgi:SagB-type dehydrogenase family enzyme